MKLLMHVDRIALASLLSAFLVVPAAALACPANTRASQVVTGVPDIQRGMSAAEVLARLGTPERKMRFERTRTTAWDYRYADLWSYDSEFSVILDDRDIVVSTLSTRNGQ